MGEAPTIVYNGVFLCTYVGAVLVHYCVLLSLLCTYVDACLMQIGTRTARGEAKFTAVGGGRGR